MEERNGTKKKSKQVRQSWSKDETDALIAIWAEPDITDAIERKTTQKKNIWEVMSVRAAARPWLRVEECNFNQKQDKCFEERI